MRKLSLIFALTLLMTGMAGSASATGRHDQPPSACSKERGAAFFLCTGFCDVLDCDRSGSGQVHKTGSHHGDHDGDRDDDDDCDDDGHKSLAYKHDSHHGDHDGDDDGDDDDHECGGGHQSQCDILQQQFRKLTGRELTCKVTTETCPCVTAFPLFAQLINSNSAIQQCTADSTVVSVITPSGMFALVNNGAQPPYCTVGNAPPFLSLTDVQATVCRDALIQAATNRGVPCNPPE